MIIDWDTVRTEEIESEYLFRFMSYERVLEFLTTQRLYFARMDQFDDMLEGISAYHTSELTLYYPKLRTDFNWNPTLGDEVITQTKLNARNSILAVADKLSTTQKAHWVNCWYSSDKESMAMWNLYTKNKGFAIRFKRAQLQDHFKKNRDNQPFSKSIIAMMAGRVVYQDFETIFRDEKGNLLKYLSFRKDSSFEHEREYRFVMVSPQSDESNPKGLKFVIHEPLENSDFCLIANPTISGEEFKNKSIEIEKINPRIKLIHSTLEPFYQIRGIAENLRSQ